MTIDTKTLIEKADTAGENPTKILAVDDLSANLLALEAVLEPLNIELVKASSGQEALEFLLKQDFALILLDVQMPEMDGFETASHIRSNKRTSHIPIIFVTAISFEDKLVFKGYETGAVDYLFKPIEPDILISKVKIFIELFKQKELLKNKAFELETANRQILEQQKALEESEVRFRTAFNQSFQFMTILDASGKILELNELSLNLYNSDAKSISGMYLWDVWHFAEEKKKKILKDNIHKAADGEFTSDEAVCLDKNGNAISILHTISPVKDEFGSVVYIAVQGHDISKMKQAEENRLNLETQLRQAQKMEALGTLAGGIAHDFNNILSVIIGYTDMGLRKVEEDSFTHRAFSKISTAAGKAKELVRQILGFSRQTELKQTTISPSTITQEAINFLRASIPATIKIRSDIDKKCGAIMADPTQFHQILMNLSTNAYHAMEYQDGILEISLKEKQVTSSKPLEHQAMEPGIYARLSVKDNGSGIDEETLEKIFDPYFTTKDIGKGTGMGLSIVHGIVKSNNGHITVKSQPGQGTVFKIYFPIIKKAAERRASLTHFSETGNEKVLLVDDEEDFLSMAREMMEMLGYTVTSQQDSKKALELFRQDPSKFDIVVTDNVMPGLNGTKLAEKMLELCPDIPIILCTGYSPDLSRTTIKELGIKDMLFKPLAVGDLSSTLRKNLDH